MWVHTAFDYCFSALSAAGFTIPGRLVQWFDQARRHSCVELLFADAAPLKPNMKILPCPTPPHLL
jgi:hypothetical protein